jgi:hypothetical protein
MANWDLTKGLQNLRAQVNAAFPDRDKTSDGTIGDKAHQAETSGHNPDDTPGSKTEWNSDNDANAEVRAWDMDSDLRAAPATAQQVVDHIRALPGVSSMLRYMIYNRRIYRASSNWKPEAYTGPSAHTEHIHFSGAYSQAADNNTTFDYRLEDIPVALTDADLAKIVAAVRAPYADTDPSALSETEAGHDVLSQQIPDGTKPGSPQTPAYKVIENMGKALVALQAQVAALSAKVSPPPAKPAA